MFELDDRRVLRRYVDSRLNATAEAALMTYAHGHGYPAPAVESADGTDIVMERISGATMLDLLLVGGLEPLIAGSMLATLLTRLHAIPPRPGCPPGDRLLHLDLHPGNVMMGSHGPVVIDWCNARNGPPDLDIAVSALILGEVIAGGHPAAAGARDMLAELLAVAGGHPGDRLAEAVRMRAADPYLEPEEVERLDRAASLVRASVPQ